MPTEEIELFFLGGYGEEAFRLLRDLWLDAEDADTHIEV